MPGHDSVLDVIPRAFPKTSHQDPNRKLQKIPYYSRLTLLDLPIEIVLQIIAWLAHSEGQQERARRLKPIDRSITHSFKALRLTSKALAKILAPVLLGAVEISCTSAARGFLQWCSDFASGIRSHLPVRRLTISNVGHSSLEDCPSHLIPYAVFEDILTLLAPSLQQLKIEFSNCFEFSEKLILNFRRANQLSVLHLRIITITQAGHSNFDLSSSRLTSEEGPHHYDANMFFKFLTALPKLFQLDLANCLDHCMPLDTIDQPTCAPSVRHLIVNFDHHSNSLPTAPHVLLLRLCRAIADSLLILEIKGSRYDPVKLLPVLRTIQGRLEALHLSDISLVPKCNDLRFPQLRSFRLDDTRYLTREEFQSPLLEKVNTLVLRRWSYVDTPLDIPVEALQNLKRVIITHTPCLTREIVPLFKACRGASVDLLSSSGTIDLSEIWAIDTMERVQEEYHHGVHCKHPEAAMTLN